MRIAVLGAGVIGQLRARSIHEHPATTLAGVADVDVASATRAAAGARALADYRPFVEDPQVEAVIVSTPIQFHEEMAIAALEAGKHVLCEKPLSNSVESCRRILDAARRHQRTLAVGFNHRYYPSIKFLKRAIDEGRIGTLDHLRVFGGHDGLANFRADWNYKGVSGGGAMMDVGIHMTDLARYLLGEVTDVYGVASERVWHVDGSEDNAVAVLRNAGGIPALYQATWTEWKGYRFYVEAYGDRGMVRGYYAPMFNLLITQDRPGGPRKKTRQVYPEIILREKLKGWTTTAYLSFQEELADFLALTRGERGAIADGWAGLRAVEIAHAVYRSSATKQAVTLTPA